jgi:Spy/CpxP family protein refolding chaperone
MKKLYAIAVTLLFVSLAAVVFAAPPDAGPGQPCPGATHEWGRPHHGFGSFLNLTKEQKDKMRDIRNSFFADTHDLRYGIREKRVEMRKLFTDPKTTDAALLAKHREMDAMLVKLMDRKAEMKLQWRKVLTPEQIGMLDRVRPFGHGRHMHRGPMGEGGLG